MQRVLHILATRRAAIAVIAAVILTLAGFAVWAARTTYQSVNNVQRLTTVNDAFQDARHAIAQENLAARRYQLRNDPVHIREYDQARAELNRSLTTVRALGSPHDLQVADTIDGQNQLASAWFAKLPAYIQNNDINHVDAVSERRLQPLFDSMAATLNSSGREHSEAALASLAQSRRSERVVMAITVITVALGILLLWAASAAMRYRERLERVRQRELERLKRAALTDSLSGLGNHRAFEEDLQRDLDRAAETGAELSLALLDLDGLKQTNDAHGHQAGDECIRSVATALHEAGPGTSAYRIGGDEFALIVHDRRAVDTLYLVQHLQTHMTASSETWPVSASSGVAESCPTLRPRRPDPPRRPGADPGKAQPPPLPALQRGAGADPVHARPGRRAAPHRRAGHRAGARGRRKGRVHAQPLRDRLRAVWADRPGARHGRPGTSAGCGWRACCTTSARSASPTPSCRSRARSPRTSSPS